MQKIIFVTGGVVSSLGKGIIAASIGRLLKDEGLRINMMKCDPYLNIDPGTISPIEHGEVFVTQDGGETDLDIGHYERFLGSNLNKNSSLTSGKVYQRVLNSERKGEYLGKTVQVIPHVTDQIKYEILNNTQGYDILIVEIGGTIGDIESLPYTESLRQIMLDEDIDTFFVHLTYIPYLRASKELKTKPTQHSVKELRGLGIEPNIIITRNEISLSEKEKEKISLFCNVAVDNVIESIDVDTVYRMPLLLKEQNIDKIIARKLNLKIEESDHEKLHDLISHYENISTKKKIGIVGKYTELEDAYKSVIEAIKHSAIKNEIDPTILLFPAAKINEEKLSNLDAIIVPGGFGDSSLEGKMLVIKYARENDIPFLGICLGMQLAAIEFARNVCGLDVDHGEMNPKGKNQLITILEDQDLKNLGGTMRLGNYPCEIKKETLAYQVYNKDEIKERHRHRYEFNNKYITELEKYGLVFSGINKKQNLVEIIEYPQNKYFIAAQFHPELTSKITDPNPLFDGLLKATLS